MEETEWPLEFGWEPTEGWSDGWGYALGIEPKAYRVKNWVPIPI